MKSKSFAEAKLNLLLDAQLQSITEPPHSFEVLQRRFQQAIDAQQELLIKELIRLLETQWPPDQQRQLFTEVLWYTVETNKLNSALLLTRYGAHIPCNRFVLLNRIACAYRENESEWADRARFVHLLFDPQSIEQLAWLYKAACCYTAELLHIALTDGFYIMENTWANIVLARDHKKERAAAVIALWRTNPDEGEGAPRASASIINLKKYKSTEELLLRPRLQALAHALDTIEGSATVAFSLCDSRVCEQPPIPLDEDQWQKMAAWPELQRLRVLSQQIKPSFMIVEVDQAINYALADTATSILKCRSDEEIMFQLDLLENDLLALVC